MKLIRVKVENFRSVENSSEFSIDDNMTCLVGKNESGKTTLLTALYRLHPMFDGGTKFNPQKDYPRRYLSDYEERHKGKDPAVITTWWTLEQKDKNQLIEKFGFYPLSNDNIKIIKGYDNQQSWNISIDELAIIEDLINTSELQDEEKQHIGQVKTIAELKSKVTLLPETTVSKNKLIECIEYDFPENSAFKGVAQVLELPKFLLFSQYQKMQGQVSLEQIQGRKANTTLTEDDQVFIALCDMAGITIEQAASLEDFESVISRFEGASSKISSEIFKYWSQNKFLKVQFRLDRAEPRDPEPFNSGRIFRTRIYNELHEVTVPFDERSTGFVWFFSFLALFSQVKKQHTGQIILLLDEPGLSLHGKAQADLLRYFKERLTPNHQLIYSTHSPFMVPPDSLLSARTVEDVIIHRKDERPEVHGTKVGSDILSTDKDTLFPLQAALGYEITQTLFIGEHTLLVEGPSDLLYLKGVSELLRSRKRTSLDQRWTICPSGGIDKVSAFMSLFGGNKLHIAVLTDFASGQKKKVEELRRSKILHDGHVFTMDTYANQAEADIEDMFGSTFYIELVNICYGIKRNLQAVPSPSVGLRIVKYVEDHFRTLPDTVPEFDHYTPAAYFIEHQANIIKKVVASDLEAALVRFEKLFSDLNGLLN
ncbi:MAG: AAA family ATPase [Nostoc sp.]|uniref:ATP-dependent nuclease n=1 Tax=Nostoc sp. TaxID=1180 RepID=UPI002FF89362